MTIFLKKPRRWKVLAVLLPTISSIFLLLLTLKYTTSLERDEKEMTPLRRMPSVDITHLDFHSDTFSENIDLTMVVETVNQSLSHETVYIGFSIVSPTNEVLDFPVKPLTIKQDSTKTRLLSYSLSDLKLDSLMSGPYQAVIALWDKALIDENAKQLDRIEVTEAFRLYNSIEHFNTIDEDLWHSRDGRLGRTQLKNEHVRIKSNRLTITHPANTLEGGEIQTKNLQHYGSYEVSMKLPNAPSSITGFFLYSPPDFYHEIDIEVFNQPDSEIWFTSYVDGSVHHEDKMTLAFDPTADFHQYRIDYYPHRVTFYIDGVAVNSWGDGFSHQPMHLMVNSWFPEWLAGKEPEANQLLYIDWIKY